MNDTEKPWHIKIFFKKKPNQLSTSAMETPINVPIIYPKIPTRIAGVTIFFCPNETAIGAATEGPIIFAADEIITS